jgi:hypothetical protein
MHQSISLKPRDYTAMAATARKLLYLPDELPISIAHHVDCNGLLALSLTCRALRFLSQEALISKEITVSEKNIWKLIHVLHKRPDLANALIRSDLKSCDSQPCGLHAIILKPRRKPKIKQR